MLDSYDYLANGCYIEADSLQDSLAMRPASRLSALQSVGAVLSGLTGERTLTLSGYLANKTAVGQFLLAHQPGTHKWYPSSGRYLNCEVDRTEISSVAGEIYKFSVTYRATDPYYHEIESASEYQDWYNGFAYSCDYTQWSQNLVTVSANTHTARCGTNHADKIVPTTSTGAHYVSRTFSVADNTAPSVGVDLQAAGYNYAALRFLLKNGTWVHAVFDLQNGTIYSQTATLAEIMPTGLTGVWRCTIAHNLGSGTSTPTFYIYALATPSNNPSQWEYAGDGTSGIAASLACLLPNRWHNRVSIHSDAGGVSGPAQGQRLFLYGWDDLPADWSLYANVGSNWTLRVERSGSSDYMTLSGSASGSIYAIMHEESLSSDSLWVAGNFFRATPGQDALYLATCTNVNSITLRSWRRWLSHTD